MESYKNEAIMLQVLLEFGHLQHSTITNYKKITIFTFSPAFKIVQNYTMANWKHGSLGQSQLDTLNNFERYINLKPQFLTLILYPFQIVQLLKLPI